MSKQSVAKEQQNYRKGLDCCGNCVNYTSEVTLHPPAFSWSSPYTTEKGMRCTLGGFAVNKTAVCDKHARKEVK